MSADWSERVESELAIRNVIALYGLAADCGEIETVLACHAEDAVYVVSNPNAGRGDASADLELVGHDAIVDMLHSDMHQSLLPNCAHTVGPIVVKVDSDCQTAKAVGYSRVYHTKGDIPELIRLAFNRWDMRREGMRWLIARRESRVMGEDAAQSMLKKAMNE